MVIEVCKHGVEETVNYMNMTGRLRLAVGERETSDGIENADPWNLWPFFRPFHSSLNSVLYCITTNSLWEGIVSKHTILVARHRNTLRTRCKKTNRSPQIQCAS